MELRTPGSGGVCRGAQSQACCRVHRDLLPGPHRRTATARINPASPLAPLAIGSVLMVMIFAGGHVSGGHYNPAVSTGVMIRGKLSQQEWVAYIVTQLVAGVIGCLLASAVAGHQSAGTLAGTGKVLLGRVPVHVRARLRGLETSRPQRAPRATRSTVSRSVSPCSPGRSPVGGRSAVAPSTRAGRARPDRPRGGRLLGDLEVLARAVPRRRGRRLGLHDDQRPSKPATRSRRPYTPAAVDQGQPRGFLSDWMIVLGALALFGSLFLAWSHQFSTAFQAQFGTSVLLKRRSPRPDRLAGLLGGRRAAGVARRWPGRGRARRLTDGADGGACGGCDRARVHAARARGAADERGGTSSTRP